MARVPVRAAPQVPAIATPAHPPLVVPLDDERAVDAELVGAKAANLARALHAGLPVLPGFALTTAAAADTRAGTDAYDALQEAWDRLTPGSGEVTLVVRSSSTAGGSASSSRSCSVPA